MEKFPCLLFSRWKEGRGCLYGRIVDLLPLSSFPWLWVPSALAMGLQTLSDHHTENSVMKISLFQQLTSVDTDQQNSIIHSHLTPDRNPKYCLVIGSVPFGNMFFYLQGNIVEHITCYICFFMKTGISVQGLVCTDLPIPGVYKLILFLSLHWLVGSSKPDLQHSPCPYPAARRYGLCPLCHPNTQLHLNFLNALEFPFKKKKNLGVPAWLGS